MARYCTAYAQPRGGTPLYKVYRYVPPQRIWFLSRFGLKTGIDFEHFGLKLGMVIGGTFTKAYKIIFLPSNPGRVAGERERHTIPAKFYLLCLITYKVRSAG